MLNIVKKKVDNADFMLTNMRKKDFGQKFDVITCFYGIYYNLNYEELEETLKNFYKHLVEGGILIFDYTFSMENWVEDKVDIETINDENLKLTNTSCLSRQNL